MASVSLSAKTRLELNKAAVIAAITNGLVMRISLVNEKRAPPDLSAGGG
jgi:hypothetical protein